MSSNALFKESVSFDATFTIPSSFMSTLAPLSSTISLITFPPEPITSLILSTGTWIVSILGAVELTVTIAADWPAGVYTLIAEGEGGGTAAAALKVSESK